MKKQNFLYIFESYLEISLFETFQSLFSKLECILFAPNVEKLFMNFKMCFKTIIDSFAQTLFIHHDYGTRHTI